MSQLADAEQTDAAERTASPTRGHGRFWRFLLRRLGALLLLAVGATTVSFLLVQVVPGDPATANLSDAAMENPAVVAAFRERYGLDKSLPVQYVTYLGNVLQGDLGTSQQTRNAVRDDLGAFIPATLELALPAMAVSILVGVGAGTLAAYRRRGIVDGAVRVTSLLGLSTPPFWLALVALYLVYFQLGWAPSGGRLDPLLIPPPDVTGMLTLDALLAGQMEVFWDAVRHLLLPMFVLAAATIGLMTRFTRASVLEVLHEDFVRTARAKGLPARVTTVRHVLRAALIPVITVAGLAFGSLLSGTVLVESIFGWPGLGQYAYQSALSLDLPAIMGVSLFVAVVYAVINFLVDVAYGVIDPRVTLQ